MRVEYLGSYDRALRKLPRNTQHDTARAIDCLLDYFRTGQRPHGLGLKRLHRHYWELRVGLANRVLFEFQEDRLTFIFVGNHDAICRWLHSA